MEKAQVGVPTLINRALTIAEVPREERHSGEYIELNLDECNENENTKPEEGVDLTQLDFIITPYTGDIPVNVANMIIEEVIKGNTLSPCGWLNDNCINIYFEYMLKPLSVLVNKDIKFLSTFFSNVYILTTGCLEVEST